MVKGSFTVDKFKLSNLPNKERFSFILTLKGFFPTEINRVAQSSSPCKTFGFYDLSSVIIL